MKKVIKAFKKLSKSDQSELYMDYSEGELERTVFPYNGDLEEGVIYKTEECIYLVPISSIIEVKSSVGEDLEEDEDASVDVGEEEISDEE
ncbi:MAG: hypothetical protein DCO96_04465 [Fluviicola sp. XM-24bin1]|nr:MAG: hypothetical protein DCO96_04465 [Fluviicola sp. XM-24bin1]